MKTMALLTTLIIGTAFVEAESPTKEKSKVWDPTYTDKSQVVDWNGQKFRGFGSSNKSQLDGRKAMGTHKTIKPEDASGRFSKKWNADFGRPRWLEKDFQAREARIVAKTREDWKTQQVEKTMAKGLDKSFRTKASTIDVQAPNRIFQGSDRASGVMYKGPEARIIQEELKKAESDLGFEEIERGHKLPIEKIKEMLNKP
jgi:hypothetical protein